MIYEKKNGVPKFECTEYAGKTKDYVVLIPIINEGERITRELLRAYEAKVSSYADIVICDGGSTDGCTEESKLKSLDVNTLLVKRDSGKQGAQLRMGIWWALQRGYKGVVTIDGNRWQVEAINPYGGDGIIIVHLSEYFNNKYEQKKKEEEKPSDTLIEEPGYPRIIGDNKIRPYDIKSYRIENANGGVWSIENPADKKTQARIISITGDTVTIEVITGKKGAFNLIYKTIDDESIILPITINSL